MARYLLELSLLENQCVVFQPVQVAGAALCLSRQILQEPLTPEGEAAWCLAFSIHVGKCVSCPLSLVPFSKAFTLALSALFSDLWLPVVLVKNAKLCFAFQ